MSCFLQTDKHINSILFSAQLLQLPRIQTAANVYDFNNPADLQKLATMFKDANIRSYNSRYPSDAIGDAFPITYRPGVKLSLMGLYKAIVSLDYQSCEPATWELSNEYKILTTMSEYLKDKMGVGSLSLSAKSKTAQHGTLKTPGKLFK